MKAKKVWRVKKSRPVLEYIIQHELNISPVLARLLVNRGIYTVEDARSFLGAELEQMYDPWLMADMDRAVQRITAALKDGEKILVYGDYDADGTTGAALLMKVLQRLGGEANYYIPNRLDEGYGLHAGAVKNAGKQGYTLVVTVDCGISAAEAVDHVRGTGGPDIIITDHHEPPEHIPQAVAVINPKRRDCRYPFKELAGVGVALKLAQALLAQAGAEAGAWCDYLDLACLGTIADIVPLQGENRVLVKYGLPRLSNTSNPGIQALLSVAGVRPEQFGTREVGFVLAPRLNAAGRIGDAAVAVDLLLCGDHNRAGELAQQLNRGNQERQRIESLVLAEALGILDAEPELARDMVIVLASAGWHPGVIGIVASRLLERYYRPVLLIALDGAAGKGSGRSIPGFHLYEALSFCREQLIEFGGHAQAAGFSVAAGRVDELRRAINMYARIHVSEDIYVPGLELDATVSLPEVSQDLVEELEMMSPFGHSNPGPVLACREARLVSCRGVGREGKHLKILVREEDAVLAGIAFNMASCAAEIAAARAVDVAFTPSINHWNGRASVQLEVSDIRPAGPGWEESIELNSPGGKHIPLEESKDYPVNALNSLQKMGYTAFLPEYISGLLSNYTLQQGCFSVSETIINHASFESGCLPDNHLYSRTLVVNNIPHRPARLKDLTREQGNTLVVAGSPARTVELALFLSGSGIPADFLHPGIDPERRKALAAGFGKGEYNVLVSTPGMVFEIQGSTTERVVFYDLPFSQEEFFSGAGASHGAEVVLFYCDAGLEEGNEFLNSFAPERDELAVFYTLIRQECPGGLLHPEEAAAYLRGKGLSRAGAHTIAAGLEIFSELGLVEYIPENGFYKVRVIQVKDKRDLSRSVTFKTGQEMKKQVRLWWRDLSRLHNHKSL